MEEEKKTEVAAVPDVNAVRKASIIKWAIVGAILLLFVGMQVGMAVFFTNKLKPESAEDIESRDEEAKKREELKAKEMGAILAAPIEVTVNINGEDGRYLKCGIQLEYDPSFVKLGEELDNRKARIKDIIIDIMSSRSLSELMTNDGKQAIREQIVRDINAILPETVNGKPLGTINRSYFDSFLMQ